MDIDMHHKGCGGVLQHEGPYIYASTENGELDTKGLFCRECRKEILGNAEILLPDDDDTLDYDYPLSRAD
jgi:hypothetical protein